MVKLVKIVKIAKHGQNCQKWSKLPKMVQNGPKWFQMIPNGTKWSQMVQMVKHGQKWYKIVKQSHGQSGLKWSKMVKTGKKNGGPDLKRARRTSLSARRARMTMSRGPKGLQLEVGPQRGP